MSRGTICAHPLAWLLVGCAGGANVDAEAASFGPGGGPGMMGETDFATDGNGNGNGNGNGAGSNDGSGTGSGTGDADCEDGDGDGFGEECNAGPDCDDDDPDVNPGEMESCDEIDHNCDGDPMAGCECPDDGVGGDCNTPYDLGTLNPTESALGVVGNVPAEGGIDWYSVSFPLADVRPGMGNPTLSFAINEGDEFVFDIVYDQCGNQGMPCGMGGDGAGLAIGLTDWSFIDDDPGCCTPPMDSMVPWPATIYIRVYRTTTGSSCKAYQLQASR